MIARALLLVISVLLAIVNAHEACHTDSFLSDPVLKEAADRSDAAWNVIKKRSKAAGPYPNLDIPITIHILYDTGNNLDGIAADEDQQWYSQYVDILKKLHLDYNQDDVNVTPHPEWQDRIGNMNLTFFINSIVYKDVGANSPYPGDRPDPLVLQSDITGDAPVDPEHTLDFWFAYGEEANSWGAYGSFPWYQIDGKYGAKFDMQYLTGANAENWYTHEVGHWVGLWHIWGRNPASCARDDTVDDTPNMGKNYNGSCPANLLGNTCELTLPGDEPDMFDNFMAYATCRRFFTEGQVQRTRTPGNATHPIGILPSFSEYDDASIRLSFEFLSFFYFVDKEEECMKGDTKKEFCLKSKDPTIYKRDCDLALCLSFSHNPFVDVYDDLALIVGDSTSCSPGYQRIDNILTSARAEEHWFVCYSKVQQTDPISEYAVTDLDISLSKKQFSLRFVTVGGFIVERTAADRNSANAEKSKVDDTVYLVTVENARNLDDRDTDLMWIENHNDVYVQIFGYGSDDEKVLQTQAIDSATEPEWNQEAFQFDESKDNVGVYVSFKFRLYDDDTVLGQGIFDDDFLGSTDEVLVSSIKECNMDYSRQMTVHCDGQEAGELFVTISKNC